MGLEGSAGPETGNSSFPPPAGPKDPSPKGGAACTTLPGPSLETAKGAMVSGVCCPFSESGRNGSRTIPDGGSPDTHVPVPCSPVANSADGSADTGSPFCISLEARPPVVPSFVSGPAVSSCSSFSGSPVFDKPDESDELSFV